MVWIACGSKRGGAPGAGHVPGGAVRPAVALAAGSAVAGVSKGAASRMIWSGTTSATAELTLSRASSPGDTVAATALMVV